jgi:LPS-assembly protein
LPGGGTAAASSAVMRPDGKRQLRRAVYSACPVLKDGKPCPATWTLKARTITDDPDSKMLSYRDVVLQVRGVPVLYLPFFAHPEPDSKRRSGLLMPDFGTNSALGGFYAQPIYWAISPSQDMTLTPRYMAKVNPLVGLQYRKAFWSGDLVFKGTGTNEYDFTDDGKKFGKKQLRGDIFGAGNFRIDDYWRWNFNVAHVSDDLYLRRYRINDESGTRPPYSSDSTRLFSQLALTGQGDSTFANLALITAQGLRAGDSEANLPRILPRGEWNATLRDPIMDGQLRLQASTVNLIGANNLDTYRTSVGGEWALERIAGPGIVVNPFAMAREDVYRVTDFGTPGTRTFGRAVGIVGIEARYPFMRAGRNLSLIIEPIVSAASSAGKNDSRIPNEDSQAFELDDSNLFRPNVTPNYDLWETGQRLSVGMRATAITDLGRASAMFGRRWKSNDDAVFKPSTNLESKTSDYVGSADIDLSHLNGSVRFRLDDQTLEPIRIDASLGANIWRVSGNVRYFDVNQGLRGSDPSREVSIGLGFKLTDHLSVGYGTRRDLDSDINLSNVSRITYRDDCTFVEFAYTREETFDRALGPRGGFEIRIGLSTLGMTGLASNGAN